MNQETKGLFVKIYMIASLVSLPFLAYLVLNF